MLPLGASAAMLGFGFLLAFDDATARSALVPVIVPIAQALVAIPFVVRTLVPALRAVDARLREAAAVLGASPWQVRREIELPLLARPLAVAAALAFAVALGEFGATVFVARADWPTVPVAIFRFLGRPGADNVGAAMALSVVLMGLVTIVALASERSLVRRGSSMNLTLERIDVTLDGTPIVDGVSLDVASGERLALLGPSGSGKSTLLRVAAGLQRPTGGRVLLDGRDVTRVPAHRRGVGLVFQDAVLFPHRDVARKRRVRTRVAGLDDAERGARVAEALELVGMSGTERRDVLTLSGGEAQRVALARSLATRPDVLLLDEPLGSLDGPLRQRLQDDLRALFERLSLTVVHVTHDVGEAFAIGDRVAVLREGRVAQVATPDELWAQPADDWVARFLGMRNVVADGDRATVTRPEAVRVVPGDDAVVVGAERDGAVVWLRVRRDDGGRAGGGHDAHRPRTPGRPRPSGDRPCRRRRGAGVGRVGVG